MALAFSIKQPLTLAGRQAVPPAALKPRGGNEEVGVGRTTGGELLAPDIPKKSISRMFSCSSLPFATLPVPSDHFTCFLPLLSPFPVTVGPLRTGLGLDLSRPLSPREINLPN